MTITQKRALTFMKSHGDWMLASEIPFQLRVIHTLCNLGLIERFIVAGMPEYKAL